MSTEAQQLLAAAFGGTLDLDADASQAPVASAPVATTESTTTPVEPAAQAASTAQDEEQVGAPIVSKSGTYTIPFEKLSSARQERDQVKAENEQLKAQLAQLNVSQARNLEAAQDLAQHRADAGGAPTQADQNLAVAQAAAAQGVDMDLFGSFSEEDIAKGVAALVEQRPRRATLVHRVEDNVGFGVVETLDESAGEIEDNRAVPALAQLLDDAAKLRGLACAGRADQHRVRLLEAPWIGDPGDLVGLVNAQRSFRRAIQDDHVFREHRRR